MSVSKNEVLLVLKEELGSLSEKIKKARENENWGTYKNLILAYKEVLMLLERQEGKIDDSYNVMYVDPIRKANEGNKVNIYCNNKMYTMSQEDFYFKDYVGHILQIAIKTNLDVIYVDIRGVGKRLYDELLKYVDEKDHLRGKITVKKLEIDSLLR